PAWLRWGQQVRWFVQLSLAPDNLVPIFPPSLMTTELWSFAGVGSLVGLVAISIATCVGVWRRNLFAFCAAAFLVSLAPILLAPPWAQYVTARYLNVGVFFVTLAMAAGLAALRERLPRLRSLFALAAVSIGVGWTLSFIVYARLWHDSYTL